MPDSHEFQISLFKFAALLLLIQDQTFAKTATQLPATLLTPTTNSTATDFVDYNDTMSEFKNETEEPMKNTMKPHAETGIKNQVYPEGPSKELEQKIIDDVPVFDPYYEPFEDAFFEGSGFWTGENGGSKSSNSDSDGYTYGYGDTKEWKFSNERMAYGEKRGYESGENLKFGLAENKATGIRAVGVSVGKGAIYGRGVGRVMMNDDKSNA